MFLISAPAIVAVIIVGVFLILLVTLFFWAIAKRNHFRRMEVKIEESASDIDVALNKRFDLLTKEYQICKGYAKHEKETFSEVTKLRSAAGKKDMETLSRINNGLDRLQKDIDLTVEQYPQLKADQVFLHLADSCKEAEETLEAARRLYNSNVSLYNQEIVVFPSSIIASFCHCRKRDLFQVEERKRNDVEMEF